MRALLGIWLAVLAAVGAQELEYRCPMDAEVRAGAPGSCPRCGMKLTRRVVDPVEHRLNVRATPDGNPPGKVGLEFTVRDARRDRPVTRFQPVHEKLFHLFVVNQDLSYFAHEHPHLDPDGAFRLRLPVATGGLHRMLADFYPDGGVPQMIAKSVILPGASPSPVALARDDSAKDGSNLRVELVTVPANPTPGVKTMLFFRVSPGDGLETYLGAWGHLFSASDDLIDLMHSHPISASGPEIQFNVIFPRGRTYRVWAQFQRNGVVNTARFDIPIRLLQ